MLIIITPPHALPDEECIVNKLFESGLHLLHLRKPGADRETLERYIRGIRPRFRERVILHDHFELAEFKQRAGLTDISSDAQLALQESSKYEQQYAENATQINLVNYLRSTRSRT